MIETKSDDSSQVSPAKAVEMITQAMPWMSTAELQRVLDAMWTTDAATSVRAIAWWPATHPQIVEPNPAVAPPSADPPKDPTAFTGDELRAGVEQEARRILGDDLVNRLLAGEWNGPQELAYHTVKASFLRGLSPETLPCTREAMQRWASKGSLS